MISVKNRLLHSVYTVLFAVFVTLFSQVSLAADKDPKVAWEMIEAGALIIDVRTPEEFNAAHLPNAINIPFEVIAPVLKKRKIAKDKSIMLYCRSGRRSGIAYDTLVAEGYTRSYNGGGFVTLSNYVKK